MNRRHTLLSLAMAGTLATLAPAVQAQADYPSKPIKLIVDGPAGGINDIWARRYTNVLGPAMKATFVIENRTGASGSLAAEVLPQAPPDGYTMFYGGMNPLVLYPGAGGKVRYDPVKDFLPVALGTMGFPTLVAGSTTGAKTLTEAIAKVGSAERTCGTGGNASVGHFACVHFARAAKIKLLTVPYKAGALAATDVAAGQIDFSAGFYSEIEALTSASKLVPLAVYGPQRLPRFPNVPTMAEAGFPGLELPSFSGFFVPVGTPAPIVARLHTELLAAMKTPELTNILANAGGVYQVMTQEAFATFYRQEIAKWKKLSADLNIRVEQ
ncbi:MAG: tripartite tricarboxylate transporter substrate binding protein [Aquabacterium sp.]|nr:tripartite tricarboxylate transporter substrate binding protein [Aquabacterium sp.]